QPGDAHHFPGPRVQGGAVDHDATRLGRMTDVPVLDPEDLGADLGVTLGVELVDIPPDHALDHPRDQPGGRFLGGVAGLLPCGSGVAARAAGGVPGRGLVVLDRLLLVDLLLVRPGAGLLVRTGAGVLVRGRIRVVGGAGAHIDGLDRGAVPDDRGVVGDRGDLAQLVGDDDGGDAL